MLSNQMVERLYREDFNLIENLVELTSSHYNRETKKKEKPVFDCTERFIMEKDTLYNDEKIETTVGRYIFNKVVLRDKILSLIKYQNKHIDDKVYKKDIDASISELLQMDYITSNDFADYLMRLENFTNAIINTQVNSFTEGVIIPNERVMRRKKELLEKHKEELEKGNVDVAVAIEKELVTLAKEELKDDPGLDNYLSGARGSFDSNYKELNIIKGPVYNSREDRWDMIENSFADGLAKKDLAAHGNAVSTGAYPKALGTAVSGHFSKQITASLETVVLDDSGHSFCGTKKTLKIFIDSRIMKEFVGRTIKSGNKDIVLTYKNIKDYADKTVDMYSPMFCLKTSKGEICTKCGDRRLIDLGIKHVGMASTRLSSTMLNMKTKQWHSATLKLTHIEPNKLFF